jgi:uncharacterized membrane protein (DUF4010 family)
MPSISEIAPTSEIFLTLTISLGLGLLVGLQRERTEAEVTGIRTTTLITLFGTVAALLSVTFGGWVLGAAFIGLAAALAMGRATQIRLNESGPGITTEISMLVMFGVGAFLVPGPREAAVALGVVVAVLLYAKTQLHKLAHKLGDKDVRATLQFALITFVVLPVLPDKAYDPWGVLNPRHIWLMVVLVVGLGMGGYAAYKLFGRDKGILLAGLLGGAISSTATAISVARRARESRTAFNACTLIIVLSTSMMFVRVLTEMAVIAPGFLRELAPPLLIVWATLIIGSGVLWVQVRNGDSVTPDPENPTELRAAFIFGALYAAILVFTAVARAEYGDQGTYIVASIAGLVNMDAISISTAQLVRANDLPAATGWRAILIAAVASFVFKTAVVTIIGGARLGLRLLLVFAASTLVAGALILFW